MARVSDTRSTSRNTRDPNGVLHYYWYVYDRNWRYWIEYANGYLSVQLRRISSIGSQTLSLDLTYTQFHHMQDILQDVTIGIRTENDNIIVSSNQFKCVLFDREEPLYYFLISTSEFHLIYKTLTQNSDLTKLFKYLQRTIDKSVTDINDPRIGSHMLKIRNQPWYLRWWIQVTGVQNFEAMRTINQRFTQASKPAIIQNNNLVYTDPHIEHVMKSQLHPALLELFEITPNQITIPSGYMKLIEACCSHLLPLVPPKGTRNLITKSRLYIQEQLDFSNKTQLWEMPHCLDVVFDRNDSPSIHRIMSILVEDLCSYRPCNVGILVEHECFETLGFKVEVKPSWYIRLWQRKILHPLQWIRIRDWIPLPSVLTAIIGDYWSVHQVPSSLTSVPGADRVIDYLLNNV